MIYVFNKYRMFFFALSLCLVHAVSAFQIEYGSVTKGKNPFMVRYEGRLLMGGSIGAYYNSMTGVYVGTENIGRGLGRSSDTQDLYGQAYRALEAMYERQEHDKLAGKQLHVQEK